ncbi:MAG: hypothetical protein KJ067_22145 [Vicinamibacteria bacterium]|nr:hypothetical protein [Vicinamibacteria bacterium]
MIAWAVVASVSPGDTAGRVFDVVEKAMHEHKTQGRVFSLTVLCGDLVRSVRHRDGRYWIVRATETPGEPIELDVDRADARRTWVEIEGDCAVGRIDTGDGWGFRIYFDRGMRVVEIGEPYRLPE